MRIRCHFLGNLSIGICLLCTKFINMVSHCRCKGIRDDFLAALGFVHGTLKAFVNLAALHIIQEWSKSLLTTKISGFCCSLWTISDKLKFLVSSPIVAVSSIPASGRLPSVPTSRITTVSATLSYAFGAPLVTVSTLSAISCVALCAFSTFCASVSFAFLALSNGGLYLSLCKIVVMPYAKSILFI